MWVNIVLNINSILCHYMEKVATNKMPIVNDVWDVIHSSTTPTIVGPKAVFTCLGLLVFFIALNKFAICVFIWSSMKRSIVEERIYYLFCSLPPPFEIFEHGNCKKIETSQEKYLISGLKEIFLKTLFQALFIGSIHLDNENTILIDDSPKKYVCNDSGNCPLFQTWSLLVASDDFFLCTLAPWLFQLHNEYSCGHLKNFVNRNWKGIHLLATNSEVFLHVANGMALSFKNVHPKYEILGVPDFIFPKWNS